MAEGIPFVPLDCHLDEKFDYIEAEFGLVGFAVVVKLFQRIYGGHGYYCEWNDKVALLFAHQINAGGGTVKEIVNAAIREGIFDKDMYQKHKILTSCGLQRRYQNVAKRRQVVFEKPEYVLIPCTQNSVNADISGEIANNCTENVCNEATSKVNESKVNKSKANVSEVSKENHAPLLEKAAEYERMIQMILNEAGAHTAADDCLTEEQRRKIREITERCFRETNIMLVSLGFDPVPSPYDNTEQDSDDLKQKLINKYGIDMVQKYEQRFDRWKAKKSDVNIGRYTAISDWMKQDNVPFIRDNRTSIDCDALHQSIMSKYMQSE